MKIGLKQGINFDDLLCVIPKPTFGFLLFPSSFTSFKFVGTNKIVFNFFPGKRGVGPVGIKWVPLG